MGAEVATQGKDGVEVDLDDLGESQGKSESEWFVRRQVIELSKEQPH